MVALSLLSTGCVKMNLSMDIRKDKSMDFVIIEAVDETLMNQQGDSQNSSGSMMDDKTIEELKKNGYQVENYSENSLVGYRISKTIKNIDDVSTEQEITSNIGLSESSDQPIFKIKKGFFKNKYQAKIVSTDSSKVTDQLDSSETNTDEDDFSSDMITEEEDTSLDDIDYSSMLASLDMKFSVNVPYKALSSNATEVSNDGKSLTWKLTELKEDEMKFEFELYNTNNIILVAGVTDVLLIILIILLLNRAKKLRKKKSVA